MSSAAGRDRTTRISKSGSMFCYPEHIDTELRRVFGDLQGERNFRTCSSGHFAAKAAHFLAEINAIHAFRDGNGRAQLVFLVVLAAQAGHPIAIERLEPGSMLQAMIASFGGNELPLAQEIGRLAG